MENAILVGTYHKTGTLWMQRVFSNLAEKLEIPFYNISFGDHPSPKDKNRFVSEAGERKEICIIFENHSRFLPRRIEKYRFKGIRVIRDPRDIIISSARYHCWAREEWLHRPNSRLGGMTYQEKINSLDNQEDQIIFEMKHSAGRTIRQMIRFKDRGIFRTVKYEQLMADYNLFLWHDLSHQLGLRGREQIISQEAFYENSIFGNPELTKQNHIQDGQVAQYKAVFTERLHRIFYAQFPNALSKLGYLEEAPPSRTFRPANLFPAAVHGLTRKFRIGR